MKSIYIFGLGIWLIILILAVLNGVARDYWYKSNALSSIVLSLLIFLVTYLFLRMGKYSEESSTYIILGLIWVVLTVAFEFLFFHYVAGHPWEELIAAYDIVHGNLWLLVVISTGVAPWLMGKLT